MNRQGHRSNPDRKSFHSFFTYAGKIHGLTVRADPPIHFYGTRFATSSQVYLHSKRGSHRVDRYPWGVDIYQWENACPLCTRKTMQNTTLDHAIYGDSQKRARPGENGRDGFPFTRKNPPELTHTKSQAACRVLRKCACTATPRETRTEPGCCPVRNASRSGVTVTPDNPDGNDTP